MDRTFVMRVALVIGAIFNFGAALLLALPRSLGQLAELPPPGSLFYAWMLALFIAIFGGVYLWLALQATINRPLIVVVIIGKVGVFAVATACWLLGEIPSRAVAPAVADLFFGLVFLWWLRGELKAERTQGAAEMDSLQTN